MLGCAISRTATMPPHRSQLPAAKTSDRKWTPFPEPTQHRQAARTNPPFLKLPNGLYLAARRPPVAVEVVVGGMAGVLVFDLPERVGVYVLDRQLLPVRVPGPHDLLGGRRFTAD